MATAVLFACSSEPTVVYVPVAPPQVEVVARLSAAEVAVSEPVILSAERRYKAEWRQVKRSSLPEGQCWVARPPPELEPEVADNLTWQSSVPSAARFNTQPRGDRTREVVFLEPGRYVLQATSAVWCGAAAGVRANSLTVEVRPAGPSKVGGQ